MSLDAQHGLADHRIEHFRNALRATGFEGDLETSPGAREVASTDNSIYRVLPSAIVYPRRAADINRIVRAAIAGPDKPLALCARGGNTGTNGQSLSRGVIVDFARHMNAILDVDADANGGTVTVEPGVVLDQLNAHLAEFGLFFPPMVSTASRATIGGMVATDASGKGSRRYGKTSDYIEAIDIVLADGQDWTARTMTREQAEQLGRRSDVIGAIHREAVRIAMDNADEIDRVFPVMNRGLTGYNLQKMYDRTSDRFFLAPLLAGSEGTLAITKAITLRVIPKPRAKALIVVRYDSFDAGLRDVKRLLEADPVAIEIIDDKILDVARTDIIWDGIAALLGDEPPRLVQAISFIEFAGDADRVVADTVAIEGLLAKSHDAILDWKVVRDARLISRLWGLREKSVGLLARLGGSRQGIPFVEDTAVPPSRLADYVIEFRAVLDSRGLEYGMFGHADVGCLHVRPFLDMKDAAQAALIRPISDAVAQLTKDYGGLLWGEHGRGFRGEYSPLFFGAKLYSELECLKRAFDPANILNPGKLASSNPNTALDRIDTVTFRGALDRTIPIILQKEFDRAIACNGNGACFTWDALDAMCPSYKATRDRAQSPKGRASLLRAWARLSSQADAFEEFEAVESATARSLSTCLSCKACTTLCPVNVDVPSMKSRFLDRYHDHHARPLRHQLLARLESMLAVGRSIPRPLNLLTQSKMAARLVKTVAGLVDLPRFSPPRRRELPPIANLQSLRTAPRSNMARTVILVEDTFTSSFDGQVLEAATKLLLGLGYQVLRLLPRANGKALHVLGFRQAFASIAKNQMGTLAQYDALGATLVGLDAATSLMYEHEYREFTETKVQVLGLETLLHRDFEAGWWLPQDRLESRHTYRLFSHCTEQSLRPQTSDAWLAVFRHFGLAIEPVRSGCCGMAGMFGHEFENQAISQRLFELSWRDALGKHPSAVLATGFSCRCQVERLAGFRPQHPIEVLNQSVIGCKATTRLAQ